MIIVDPLSGDADPRLYVPLDSSERTLAAISAALEQGHSPVLLTGPSGIGKTLLLTVLAERERRSCPRVRLARSLYLEPDEIAGSLLHLLFGKSCPDGVEPEASLLEELHAPGDDPIVLLVDEIHRSPAASVRKLAELARAGRPALSVVVAGTNGRDLISLIPVLSPEVTVALPDSLPGPEIDALYETILTHPGLSPRFRLRLSHASRAEVTQASAGVPRLLKSELARRGLHGAVPARLRSPQRTTARPVASVAETEPPSEWEGGAIPRARSDATRRAIRGAAAWLARRVVATGRAAGALRPRVTGSYAVVTRAPRAIGSALRGTATAAFEAARRAGARLARPIGIAARLTRTRIARMSAHAARSRGRSARRRTAPSARLGADGWRLALGSESVGRAKPLHGEVARNRDARQRRGSARIGRLSRSRGKRAAARTRLAGSVAGARRAGAALHVKLEHVRDPRDARPHQGRLAAGANSAALAQARRAALSAAPGAALPAAAALIAVALYSAVEYGTRTPALPASELPAVGAPPSMDALPTVIDSAARPPVNVQVNARPWARVRIDGVDVGATPLSRRLAPGVYRLEAEFPDGQRIERRIDVGPGSRFVSLP
jgi:hypothetical protein